MKHKITDSEIATKLGDDTFDLDIGVSKHLGNGIYACQQSEMIVEVRVVLFENKDGDPFTDQVQFESGRGVNLEAAIKQLDSKLGILRNLYFGV